MTVRYYKSASMIPPLSFTLQSAVPNHLSTDLVPSVLLFLAGVLSMADHEINKYAKHGFHYLVTNALYILLMIPLFCIFLVSHFSALTSVDDLFQIWNNELKLNSLTLVSCLALVGLALISFYYLMSRPRKVYLVNFSCYKSDDSYQMCSAERLLETSRKTGLFSEETLEFQKKILEGAGIGSKSYLPRALLEDPLGSKSIANARKETETVMIGAVDELLAKTGVNSGDIGILIVNCSMFCPTPSLSAMIVNHYKLGSNTLAYNLGGMGCSCGLISIDLAQRLLQTVPNSYALVVSADNILLNWYPGNERSMSITNCAFKLGGAAILLSNRSADRNRSKYQLLRTLRTHMGAKDRSYNSIFHQEDELQNVGFKLSKDLTTVIGEILSRHITTLGPLVLPMSEKLVYLANLLSRKIFRTDIKPYIPDFKLAFEHFCVHAGGKPLLDEVRQNLELKEWHLEPSRMTLYRFGNTASSSVWYVLGYSEAKGRIRKGDRIWQVAFGSGVKCSSAVWRALKTVNPAHDENINAWSDEIDDFPVEVSKLPPIAFFQR